MGHFIYIFIINYRIYSYNNKVQVFLSGVRTTVTFEDSELQEVSVIRKIRITAKCRRLAPIKTQH